MREVQTFHLPFIKIAKPTVVTQNPSQPSESARVRTRVQTPLSTAEQNPFSSALQWRTEFALFV